MDLALVLIVIGVVLALLTSLNAIGYALVLGGVILVIVFAFSGRGTFYRRS